MTCVFIHTYLKKIPILSIYSVDGKKFYKREILGFAICGAKGYFGNAECAMERIYVYTIGGVKVYTS